MRVLNELLHRGQRPQEITPIVGIDLTDVLDVTAEEVRTRREARNPKPKYEVKNKNELVVPTKYHTGEGGLASLVITASSVAGGTSWMITATLFTTMEEFEKGNRFQLPLGRIGYEGEEPITPQEALDKIGRKWLIDSCTFVAPDDREIPMPPEKAGYTGARIFNVR